MEALFGITAELQSEQPEKEADDNGSEDGEDEIETPAPVSEMEMYEAGDTKITVITSELKREGEDTMWPMVPFRPQSDVSGKNGSFSVKKKPMKGVKPYKKTNGREIADDDLCEAHVKASKMPKSSIPAVEVDPPGCSYNPPFEAHQDALAQAVADEIQKVYRQELAPQPLPNVALAAEINDQTVYSQMTLQGIDGSREKVLAAIHISAKKNTAPGKVSAIVPGRN